MGKNIVIIGGGLGGLFSGAILAKEGYKVTVVEKNSTIGGGLQSFTRFGEKFDTGMHIASCMKEGQNLRRLCDYLGVTEQFDVLPVDDNCADRIYVEENSTTYEIKKGEEGFVSSLSKYFPEEEANLRALLEANHRLVEELPLFLLLKGYSKPLTHSPEFFLSVREYIAKYIGNEQLRSVLAHIAMLYSCDGNTTPAYIHAVVNELYLKGPVRFVDGSDSLANALADVITDNGGMIITNEQVKYVAVKDKCIEYISTSTGDRYYAHMFISDIHPNLLIDMLSNPSALPAVYRERVKGLQGTTSAFTINLKFKPNSFKYQNFSGWYISNSEDIWSLGARERWPQTFLYMTPPVKNQGEFSTKMMITVPMDWEFVEQWADSSLGHRPEEYRKWKNEMCQIVLDKMEAMYPGFKNAIENINTASPLTIRDYYGSIHGEMSGFAKNHENVPASHLSVKTKIKNLFLTGQYVSLHGIIGVPLTAIKTTEAILGENYVISKL